MSTKRKNISTPKFILKYGVIWGGIWAIYFCIRFASDNLYHDSNNWFFYIIEIVLNLCIICPIYKYKSLNHGALKLSDALKIGVGVSFIIQLIYMICTIVVEEIIPSEYIMQFSTKIQEKLLINNPNMTPEEIQKTMRFDKMFFKLWNFTFGMIYGFLIPLIAGVILRKKKTV